MINTSRKINSNQKTLQLFLINELLKKSKKIRGKFSPISELIENKVKVMKIVKLSAKISYSSLHLEKL